MSTTVWIFLLCGVLGIFGEVVFTAILDIFRNRRLRLHGFSFIWMFPIYGLLAILFPPLSSAVEGFPWPVRGVSYMIGIYLVEFVSGSLLTALTGSHIWCYKDRWNFRGQITLLYAPVWFFIGLMVERYYPWAERVSRALAGIS